MTDQQLTAQQLADAYVERVNDVNDIPEASAWAREEFGEIDPQVAEEAAKLVHAALIAKGVVPESSAVRVEANQEQAVEAPAVSEDAVDGAVEASDEASPEAVETPAEDEKPSENA